MLASPEPAWRDAALSAKWKLDGDFSLWCETGDPKPSGKPQARLGPGSALALPFGFFFLSHLSLRGL